MSSTTEVPVVLGGGGSRDKYCHEYALLASKIIKMRWPVSNDEIVDIVAKQFGGVEFPNMGRDNKGSWTYSEDNARAELTNCIREIVKIDMTTFYQRWTIMRRWIQVQTKSEEVTVKVMLDFLRNYNA